MVEKVMLEKSWMQWVPQALLVGITWAAVTNGGQQRMVWKMGQVRTWQEQMVESRTLVEKELKCGLLTTTTLSLKSVLVFCLSWGRLPVVQLVKFWSRVGQCLWIRSGKGLNSAVIVWLWVCYCSTEPAQRRFSRNNCAALHTRLTAMGLMGCSGINGL